MEVRNSNEGQCPDGLVGLIHDSEQRDWGSSLARAQAKGKKGKGSFDERMYTNALYFLPLATQ